MKRTQILIVLLIVAIIDAFGQDIVNFNGIIKDSYSGELLEGINVYITEKNTGTISDEVGEFFIFLPGGIYNITFSAEGYRTEKMILDLREDKFSEIILLPTDEIKKKNDQWLRRKNHYPEEVMIEKHKSKTVKSS